MREKTVFVDRSSEGWPGGRAVASRPRREEEAMSVERRRPMEVVRTGGFAAYPARAG